MKKNVENVLEGDLQAKGLRFAIVCARFNEFFVGKLLDGAWVPGSYEIPLVVAKLAKSAKYDAIIALGVVIQGATPHASLITAEVNKCLAQISLDNELPIINGVLATNNIEQAIERSGTKAGNKGGSAAVTAIEMVNLMKNI